MITKATLLDELKNQTYVILRPSNIAGIGVFALRPIPKGCRDMFSQPNPDDEWITISKEEVQDLPAHSRISVENYCLFDTDQYYVPAKDLKRLMYPCS